MCYYYSLSTSERQDGKPRANDQWLIVTSYGLHKRKKVLEFGDFYIPLRRNNN